MFSGWPIYMGGRISYDTPQFSSLFWDITTLRLCSSIGWALAPPEKQGICYPSLSYQECHDDSQRSSTHSWVDWNLVGFSNSWLDWKTMHIIIQSGAPIPKYLLSSAHWFSCPVIKEVSISLVQWEERSSIYQYISQVMNKPWNLGIPM